MLRWLAAIALKIDRLRENNWMRSSRWKVAEIRAELAGKFGDDEDDVDDGECGALMDQQEDMVEEEVHKAGMLKNAGIPWMKQANAANTSWLKTQVEEREMLKMMVAPSLWLKTQVSPG